MPPTGTGDHTIGHTFSSGTMVSTRHNPRQNRPRIASLIPGPHRAQIGFGAAQCHKRRKPGGALPVRWQRVLRTRHAPGPRRFRCVCCGLSVATGTPTMSGTAQHTQRPHATSSFLACSPPAGDGDPRQHCDHRQRRRAGRRCRHSRRPVTGRTRGVGDTVASI